MKRFVVVVLDGLGIGAMEDVPAVRPEDMGACTLGSILESRPDLRLPNLERLGLMNALGRESARMRFSASGIWGRGSLMHWGADTFWGHQEILGTLPKRPRCEPFSTVAEKIESLLLGKGYKVRRVGLGGLRPPGVEVGVGVEVEPLQNLYLLQVEDAVTLGDNLEADPGQNYNVTAVLDRISFDEALRIGRYVRESVEVSRVICFGNPSVNMDCLLSAMEVRDARYMGVSSARSGVYGEGYRCIHMGYGVDSALQIPALLAERGVPVLLFGKVADIVENPRGESVSWVDTEEVLSMTMGALTALERGFVCTNVQETDLAGHMQSAERYAEALEKADPWIGRLMERLRDDDVLLVMADHGNDPNIGHTHHTREKVPILVYSPRVARPDGLELGERDTLSDVGATVAAYFGARAPENPHAKPIKELLI
ncbi:MAG: phosphopentomutase [Synergistaceae bacterium]|nr:phosphopentomutase [Synergistaceae bacterium]